MARDFEDIRDLDDLNEEELTGLVREHLREQNALDPDDISVRVDGGFVVLAGRVGTDGERRIAEHVVTDVIGIVDVRNELVVDATRRAESPVAIDEHLAAEDEQEGLLLGERPASHSDEAAHFADRGYGDGSGTADVQDAIEGGTAWIPPTSPTPEGMRGTDADVGSLGEDH